MTFMPCLSPCSKLEFLKGLFSFDFKEMEHDCDLMTWWETYGVMFCLFCVTIMSSVDCSEKKGQPRLFFVHSFLLTVFKAFGGGCLAFMMIGKMPVVVHNDAVVPFCVISWFCVRYTPLGDVVRLTPVKYFYTFFANIFRTTAICNMTKLAFETIPTFRQPLYEIQLVGPILCGAIMVALGPFIPLDLGFSPVKKHVPWIVQGSLYSAVFFHLVVDDQKGWIGTVLRGCVGGVVSEQTVRMIIALSWIVSAFGQIYRKEYGNTDDSESFHVYRYINSVIEDVFTFPLFPVKMKEDLFSFSPALKFLNMLLIWYFKFYVIAVVMICITSYTPAVAAYLPLNMLKV